MKAKSEKVKGQSKGHSLFKLGALAVVIVVAAVFLASYIINSSKAISPPALPHTNASVPVQFSNLEALSGTQASALISSMIRSHISNTTNLDIKYRGQVYGHLSGLGAFVSLSTPIVINYSKSGNSFTMEANMTSIPFIGSGVLELVNKSGSLSLCANFNLTAIQDKSYLNARSKSGLSCSPAGEDGITSTQIEFFNFSSLSSHGISMNIKSVYESKYRGIPCTVIQGILSQPSESGAGTFSLCMDNSKFVPLTIYGSFKSQQVTGSLKLNETSIS
ncbi:MAG: hypothetical protein KGH94_00145 [Candidatus Micrarchaeota archaeon]|nr:hypothetical protein [Candidatus Micrarchaeota archaeon]